MDFKLS